MSEKIETIKNRVRELEKMGIISKIEDLLNQLKKIIIEENNERALTSMISICAQCGKEGKVCCGSAIEFKYSEELLLINILYEVKLPDQPEFSDMCFFLTKSGCSLFARDAFCINFICDKIKEKIPTERLKKLRQLEGEHLSLQFQLEQMLKKFSGVYDLTTFQNYNTLNYPHT